ncbi:unnamed protein product [Arctogadus glacialis]
MPSPQCVGLCDAERGGGGGGGSSSFSSSSRCHLQEKDPLCLSVREQPAAQPGSPTAEWQAEPDVKQLRLSWNDGDSEVLSSRVSHVEHQKVDTVAFTPRDECETAGTHGSVPSAPSLRHQDNKDNIYCR